MKKTPLNKALIVAALLAATGLSTLSSAQNTRPTAEQIANMHALNNGGSNIQGQRGVLPCCKCVGQSTSANLSTGVNTTWTVTGPSGASATANAANVAWTTMLAPSAQWISPVGNPTAVGVYTYETKIDLRNCIIPSAVTIEGKFLADNKAVLLVDGREVKASQGTPNYGFLPGSLTPFSYTLPAGSTGMHTITVRARNDSGPTGIVVVANATRKCGDNPEAQSPKG